MGRKFIKQVNNQNFIYPNNNLAEYDVELVQDLNENSVSGTVVTLSATTVASTGITFSLTYTWSKNGAETFINQAGNMPIVSVHMMGPTQLYYKPFRLVNVINASSTGSTIQSGTTTFNVVPSQLGLTSFSNGTYNFEIRFIGHRAIYPVCQSVVISSITPPPTPTPTPTPPPTVTPTPTPPPPPPDYTTGVTLNVTDTGWIKYSMSSGTTYQFIGSTGTVVLTNCLDCDTIMEGIPFADLAVFTITNCGSTCSPPPTPTPPPSKEASAGGYMEPCIGGTIDDFMGASVYLTSPVTVDTIFDVTVYYQTIGSSCPYPNITTGTYSQFFQITVLAGQSSSNFNACINGYYFPSGANICGACITNDDNTVDTITYNNPVGC